MPKYDQNLALRNLAVGKIKGRSCRVHQECGSGLFGIYPLIKDFPAGGLRKVEGEGDREKEMRERRRKRERERIRTFCVMHRRAAGSN